MTFGPRRRVVMIVEDDGAIRESLAEILTDNEYGTITAANGQEAILHLRSHPDKPCLILLDIMMPVMDGWQFRMLQREDPTLQSIPVVVLTAHANLDLATTGMQAQACLKKPVGLRALMTTVERLCPKAAPAGRPA